MYNYIREKSKAHIKISKLTSKDSLLEVAGEEDQFKPAMRMVMDAIREKVVKDFEKEDVNCSFQTKDLQVKKYSARIVLDQEDFSPALFHLNFVDNEEIIEIFEPINDIESMNMPPKSISRNCAILAPYGGVLYRAKPIGIRTSEDETKIDLKVKFVDYGNKTRVDLMKCRDCPSKHMYPPRATAVRLWNIKVENWNLETLNLFRQLLLNNGDKTFEVKVVSKGNENEGILSVSLWIPGVGDVLNYLVGMKAASYVDDPFLPMTQPSVPVSTVGSTQMLYVQNGCGYTVTIDVSSKRRNMDEDFTFAANFNTPLFKDSLQSSYIASKRLLESKNCFFLSEKTLYFGTRNVDDLVHEYYGSSGGLAFTMCILSESLGFKIPGRMAFTGEVTGHGQVSSVGGISEKLRAAKDCGKEIIFVPEENGVEAMEENCGLEVKTCRTIEEVLDFLRSKQLDDTDYFLNTAFLNVQ